MNYLRCASETDATATSPKPIESNRGWNHSARQRDQASDVPGSLLNKADSPGTLVSKGVEIGGKTGMQNLSFVQVFLRNVSFIQDNSILLKQLIN